MTKELSRVGEGILIEAYCNYWSKSDFKWCYLASVLNVQHCPGATASSGGKYWTRDADVCKGSVKIAYLIKSLLCFHSTCFD